MQLTTRCPECETVFQVSMAQLQLRKGYIRCIQCAHIFDGFDAAVPVDSSQAGGRSPAAPVAATPAPPAARAGAAPAHPVGQPRPPAAAGDGGFYIPPPDRAHSHGPTPARPFSIGTGRNAQAGETSEPSVSAGAPFIPESASPEPRVPSVLRQRDDLRAGIPAAPSFTISDTAGRQAGAQRSEPGIAGADSPLDRPLREPATKDASGEPLFMEPHEGRRSDRNKPEFMAEPRRAGNWMTATWAILLVCGLAVLLLQGVYVYRAQLANNFPGLRPSLEAACERIGCKVPYERHIEAIAITGSALRSTGAPQDDVSNLMLEVTLRNTHERPQEWPTLVLDLKDASGTVVVRRNLAPENWVPAQLRDGPFAAGSELVVQLPVTVRGLQANGYQLDKFFP